MRRKIMFDSFLKNIERRRENINISRIGNIFICIATFLHQKIQIIICFGQILMEQEFYSVIMAWYDEDELSH